MSRGIYQTKHAPMRCARMEKKNFNEKKKSVYKIITVTARALDTA